MDNAASDNEKLGRILQSLEDIKDKLTEVNKMTGALAQYESMKQELKGIGWSGVCAKYHPDINVGDPAAYELFAMYRFVYDTMNKEQHRNL